MDTRYSHPRVDRLWSPTGIYEQWLQIEKAVFWRQRETSVVPLNRTDDYIEWLTSLTEFEPYQVVGIARIEQVTKHDVAAFLEWLRTGGNFGGDDLPGAEFLHFGLTSSDVVDTAQGLRFKAMLNIVSGSMSNLISELTRLSLDTTPILGRTHGQPAEPMEMRARAAHWLITLGSASTDLLRDTRRMGICKLSGPVGTFAHNTPELELMVAKDLGLRAHGAGASQIATRASLAAWANSAALVVGACSKIAMDVRLMNLLGEVKLSRTDGQVGSSAMPHKVNPIQAEQITGLQRLARGYASMLQPLDDWLERDIAHSCVERVAVPDLWHIVMRAIEQTTEMLSSLDVDVEQAAQNIKDAGIDAMSSANTLSLIRHARIGSITWNEARRVAMEVSPRMGAVPGHAAYFMRNYPEMRIEQQ